jgi:broad specificity phosphatase PhoE
MDHSLTERGRLQALQTGEYLSGRHIDEIFCSSMKRAHETAQITARQMKMELTVLDEFRELNVGELEGMDFTDENWTLYHDVTNHWYAGNSQASFPGGEDYVAVWERTKTGYLKVLQDYKNGHFAVVGHGGIFISTLKDFCPGPGISWLQNAVFYNCAITELEMEILSGEWKGRIVSWSDHHHLRGDALTTSPAIPPLSSIQEK